MGIPEFTKDLLKKYDRLRGVEVTDEEFWDVVVLTASDEDQAFSYQQQVDSKIAQKQLPLGVKYLIFSDPPGPKIGCGGSTIFVVRKLYDIYSEDLWTKRILLLNAGGQSQRLPSASIVGKIFMALPIGDPMYQLFDLKMAWYLPILPTMPPGIFHASGDTIESYDLGEKCDVAFNRPGFTALAHPSSLEIGKTHGVFVMNDPSIATGVLAYMNTCLEVLQKPSIERMKTKKAIFTLKGQEVVYTDSCFFFDHNISKKFLEYYKENGITCEIDSYGDFLQGLGPNGTSLYTQDLKNVSKIENSLVETRLKIYNLLKDTPLNVLVLDSSNFYHFGTMPEYIDNFTRDEVSAKELGYCQVAFSIIEQISSNDGALSKKAKISPKVNGRVMHSIMQAEFFEIGCNCVIEYCDFKVPVNFHGNSIVSNCQLLKSDLKCCYIPKDVFIHTAWMKVGTKSKAITFVLGVYDNVKKRVNVEKKEQVEMFGKPLSSTLNLPVDSLVYSDQVCSLWTAKIFIACETMSDSFQATYYEYLVKDNDLNCLTEVTKERFSIQEIVKAKDLPKMLSYRQSLFSEISQRKPMTS